MKKRTIVLWMGVVAVPSFAFVACGGRPATPMKAVATAAPSVKPPVEVREVIVPRTCAARMKLAKLLGHVDAPAVVTTPEDVGEAPPPTSLAASTRLASNQAYRVVAPSTALVSAGRGFGTGVVIDPSGYVLTNYHVVADGRKKDFIVEVDVTFGDLTPTGRMNRQAKSYEAVVVKVDPVRDLAIVKLKGTPPKLVAAKLAKSAPQIAEKVMSIGHAGIGFLWAAKTCNVASIGERQEDSSIIAGVDCSHPDPAASAEQATKQKKSCEEQKRQMKDALASKTQGLAVQTDCAITHGDSGGPLVNMAGELVGLNQSISADLATASFHVHLEEVRDFAAKFGDSGVPILPDPFCDGGFDPTFEDLDLDGTNESLVAKGGGGGMFGGSDRMSLLIDLDQSHFKGNGPPSQTFDAEVAMMTLRDTTYIWYDTDNDGRLDVLLVDKDDDGVPESAYQIAADGRLKEDKEILPKHDLSGRLIKDPTLHARLGKIATAIGGTKYVSARVLALGEGAGSVPDPLSSGGSTGRAVDTDDNGKPDLAAVRGAFSRGVLIDADEDTLGRLKPGDSVDDLVKAKKIDAEIAVIAQGSSVWAMYDTDNDSKFDLALNSKGGDSTGMITTAAWSIGGSGAPRPAPDHVGRKVFRPGLIGFPRATQALRSVSSDVADDEALGSLPATIPPRARFHTKEVKGLPEGMMIESSSFPWIVELFDVDRSSKIGPKTDVQKVVADGKFDAEVAFVRHLSPTGALTWVYYDTDNDGRYDLVLFLPKSDQEPTQAFRVVKRESAPGGLALEADAAALKGRPIRHKAIFKDPTLGQKWKGLASKVFKPDFVEP
ncbi:MAG TPA: serine protease [Polyangiaceae bacterium]|nr:serine protease [Polyangiaceae bacterium]